MTGAAKRQAVGIKHRETHRQSDTVRTYYSICRGLDVDSGGDDDDEEEEERRMRMRMRMMMMMLMIMMMMVMVVVLVVVVVLVMVVVVVMTVVVVGFNDPFQILSPTSKDPLSACPES